MQATGSKDLWVILAMEVGSQIQQIANHSGLDAQRQEREKEAKAKAENLKAGLFRFWQN